MQSPNHRLIFRRPFVSSTLQRYLISFYAFVSLAAVAGSVRADPAPPIRLAQKWALLIGIDLYKENGIVNLRGAATDARALKAAFVEAAGFPESNVTLLVSDADPARGEVKPGYGAIIDQLGLLQQKVQPGDTVFVSYSGHGIETHGKTDLLPWDTQLGDVALLTQTAIPTTLFGKHLWKTFTHSFVAEQTEGPRNRIPHIQVG